ncbi:MAG: hypothetical protein HYS14_04350 [Candidatus Rokubacteria bacterium]|nr:hypothetical protein [Candidatus Rokubacteria bacterium]
MTSPQGVKKSRKGELAGGEDMKRAHELKARGIEKILILDRGNVELGVPRGWSVEPVPEGFMRLKDPTDSCLLEVSYLRLPPLLPSAPPLEERLRLLLEDHPEVPGHTPKSLPGELGNLVVSRGGFEPPTPCLKEAPESDQDDLTPRHDEPQG